MKIFENMGRQRALLVHSEAQYAELVSMQCFFSNVFHGGVVNTKFFRQRQNR